MSGYLDRLKQEKMNLTGKRIELRKFTTTEQFTQLDDGQRSLVFMQLGAMQQYEDALIMRLGNIPKSIK